MAAMHVPETIEALRAAQARRGQSERIVVRLDDAMAGGLEGIAFGAEVVASIQRISLAALAGSRHAVVNEANRLAERALRHRDECRRILGRIDGPDAA